MKDIELLKELRKKINLDKNVWENTYATNCYAYALGLDIPESSIMKGAFLPGTMSGTSIIFDDKRLFSYASLIDGLYGDLEALDIIVREISPSEDINSDEWKIALYTTPSFLDKESLMDFHFFRFCNDEIWRHKMGWTYPPSIYDDNRKVIRNLDECYFKNKVYNKCFSLKLKK